MLSRTLISLILISLVCCGPSQEDIEKLRNDFNKLEKQNELLLKKILESETKKNKIIEEQKRLRVVEGSVYLQMRSGDVRPQKGMFVGIIEDTHPFISESSNYYKQAVESSKYVENFYDANIDAHTELTNEINDRFNEMVQITKKIENEYTKLRNIIAEYEANPSVSSVKLDMLGNEYNEGLIPIYYEEGNPIAFNEAKRLRDTLSNAFITMKAMFLMHKETKVLFDKAVAKIKIICDESSKLSIKEREILYNSLKIFCFTETVTDLEGNFQLIIPEDKEFDERKKYTLIAYGDRPYRKETTFECWKETLNGPYTKPYKKVILGNAQTDTLIAWAGNANKYIDAISFKMPLCASNDFKDREAASKLGTTYLSFDVERFLKVDSHKWKLEPDKNIRSKKGWWETF